MIVSIEFFGMQRIVAKTDRIDMPISEKTMVADALEYAKRQYPDLSLDKGAILTTVNRQIASLNSVLVANDIVSFLPHINGG